MSRYCKVLVIDDEFITRQGIKHMLLWEQEGFQIVGEVSNGQEGLEMIEKYRPEIVLADIVMPVLNGIDFSLILQEKYPEIQLIILSSYDNFEYVRATLLNGAVDYVLKPTLNPEILLRALKKAADSIPGFQLDCRENIDINTQLERYLTGYQDALEEEGLKNSFPYLNYRILAVDMKKACRNNSRQMEQLQEMLEDKLKKDGFETYQLFWLEQEILCCIINYKKKLEEALLLSLQSSAERAGKIAENILFVVSRPFTDLTHIKEIYETGVKSCLYQKFYFHERTLISEEEGASGEVRRFPYEEYTELLKKKQYMQGLESLEKHVKYLAENRYDEYLSKNLLKNLLYNFLMEIEKYGVESDRLRGEFFRKIDETDSVEAYRDYCEREALAALKKIAAGIEKNVDTDPVIGQIREYIDEHYAEKLDLSGIAQEFGFNYHYISSYFNQHVPEGFSGYLNTVRIEKSCVLLRDTKNTISDISAMVGYSDHGYYCRIFRKHMGETPSQYRHSSRTGGKKNEK